MKPTRAINLIIAALISGVAGYVTATYLVSRGYAIPTADYNLMFTLPAIAVILALLALPIWRYRQQTLKLAKTKQTVSNSPSQIKRVDPFYAVRILILAKATAIAASLFIGWHLSLVIIQISSPDVTTTFIKNLITLIGSVVALVIALVIEWICRIPDSPDNLEQQAKLKGNPADPAMSKERHD